MQQIIQIAEVLAEDRIVQPHLFPQLRDRFLGGGIAGHQAGRVARHQSKDDEHEVERGPGGGNEEEETANDITAHGAAVSFDERNRRLEYPRRQSRVFVKSAYDLDASRTTVKT